MNTSTLPTRPRPAVAPAPAQSAASYTFPVVRDDRLALARAWLWLGMAALVGSGLFSILLVVSRTPGLNSWLPAAGFFHVALVAHVDLSVLVWFCALAGMLWSLNTPAVGQRAAWSALALCAAGTAAMAVAPFTGQGQAVMSNYIPMLTAPLFIGGLLAFAAGVAVLVLHTMLNARRPGPEFDGRGALAFALNAAAVATAVALIAFAWSWAVVPASLEGKAYYEVLFWGGGHALQFTWTLLMLAAWLWLASACGGTVPLSPRLAVLMFALALAGVFATPVAYLAFDVASVEHRAILTWGMRLGGGMAILPVGLAAVWAVSTCGPVSPQARPWRAALLSSVLLFASGGVIGIFLAGNDVRIPAHYHGCIVGVTLALMGLVYKLLPALGYAEPQGRLASLQPWIYGAGQLAHITGLVWSGGYGVQRKVAGAGQVLRTPGEVAGMALMGAGGAIAIAGGLLFVVIVLRAMRRRAAAGAGSR